jgi:uncharacterized protein YyaL (SSP411 family)
MTGERIFLDASTAAMELLAPLAVQRAISFGAALGVMSALSVGAVQLVVVADGPENDVTALARQWQRSGTIISVVTSAQATAFSAAGFDLYTGRVARDGMATAYLCEDFICQLPLTSASELAAVIAAR